MNLNQMRYFQSVCVTMNMTVAAEHLNISQPSLSVSIRQLEDEMGVQLFFREKNKLILTPAGEEFLAEVSRILTDVDDLATRMNELGKKEMRKLNIGMPPLSGALLFPEIFSIFQTEHPEIRMKIYETSSIKLTEMILDKALDIAVVPRLGDFPDHIKYTHLFNSEICLLVGKDHPLASQEYVCVEELKDIPFVFCMEGFNHYAMIQELFNRHKVNPRVLLHSDQIYTTLSMVRSNIASTFYPRNIIYGQEGIQAIPLDPPYYYEVGIIRNRDKYYSSAAKQFYKFVCGRKF